MKALEMLNRIPSGITWKTLYLVSALSKNGEWLWKVGITKHDNPLKRNPKQYSEVFRSVRLPHGWAHEIELCIAQTFNSFERCAEGREYLTGKFSLEQVAAIYDFWLEAAMDAECYRQDAWDYRDGKLPRIVGSDIDHENCGMNAFDKARFYTHPQFQGIKAAAKSFNVKELDEMW